MSTFFYRIGVWLMLTGMLGAAVRPDADRKSIGFIWLGASMCMGIGVLGAIPNPGDKP